VGLIGAKIFSRISLVPPTLLWPTVFALCFVGAYGLEQSLVDVWVMLAAGLIGFGLKRYGFSPAPIIMGLVLGGLVETSLAQSMIIFDQQWTGFLQRPISLVFFALALISVLNAPVRGLLKRGRSQ
jgi:putative tricarboxylic transport membrane protein